jgi:uncharacterized membrane protein YbhN (UPF0104 family)
VRQLPPWLRWGGSALVVALAGWLLWRQLQLLSLGQLLAALRATPPLAIAASLAATALSFAGLAAYERLATQWLAPGRVPRAEAWRVGLEAHALANTLGFHALTAVALRLRAYRALGLEPVAIAKIVALIGACVATGVATIVVAALAWSQVLAGRGVLVLVLALLLAVAIAVARSRAAATGAGAQVLAHAGRLAGIGLLEMGAAVSAFAVLVPAGALPQGPLLVLLFVSAMALGIVSHAPGGLGVFEATILSAAPESRRAEVLAALLGYRVLYNLLPCTLALVAIAAARWRRARASSTAGTRA